MCAGMDLTSTWVGNKLHVCLVVLHMRSLDLMVGTCWQHNADLDLKFHTEESFSTLKAAISADKCHLVSEVTAVAVAGLGNSNYSARVIAALPHCKTGAKGEASTAQLKLLRSLVNHWWAVGGLHMTNGPLWAIASDGAPQRRAALMMIFETDPLPASSPLLPTVSRCKLLDNKVSNRNCLIGMCVEIRHPRQARQSIACPTAAPESEMPASRFTQTLPHFFCLLCTLKYVSLLGTFSIISATHR